MPETALDEKDCGFMILTGPLKDERVHTPNKPPVMLIPSKKGALN
jgi:hypothetical protein